MVVEKLKTKVILAFGEKGDATRKEPAMKATKKIRLVPIAGGEEKEPVVDHAEPVAAKPEDFKTPAKEKKAAAPAAYVFGDFSDDEDAHEENKTEEEPARPPTPSSPEQVATVPSPVHPVDSVPLDPEMGYRPDLQKLIALGFAEEEAEDELERCVVIMPPHFLSLSPNPASGSGETSRPPSTRSSRRGRRPRRRPCGSSR
jgi:hypothetical protein